MTDTRFAQLAIFINSAVPLTLLGWDWYHHRLGANPPEFATRTTGVLTLVFFQKRLLHRHHVPHHQPEKEEAITS